MNSPTPTSGTENQPTVSIWSLFYVQRSLALIALCLVLLGSLLSLLQPLVAGSIVDAVSAQRTTSYLIIALIIAVAAQVSVESFGNYLQELMGERAALSARERMTDTILSAPLEKLGEHKTGDLVSRLTTDAEAIRDGVSRGYIQLVSAVVTACGASILLFLIDRLLLVVVAIVLVLAALGSIFFLQKIEQAAEAKQHALGAVGTNIARVFQGIRTIRLFAAHRRERQRLSEELLKTYDSGRKFARWGAAITPAIELAATGTFLALLIVGGSRVAAGALDLGALVSALLYSTILVVPLGSLIESGISLSTAAGALRRINALLSAGAEDEATLPDSAPTTTPIQLSPILSRQRPAAEQTGTNTPEQAPTAIALAANEASFALPSGDVLLPRVDLSLPIGAATLLHGPSGSGKTTFINVLCKFYLGYSGSIQMYGKELRDMDAATARNCITLVEQDSPILFGSVREALAYGTDDLSEPQMLRTLESIGLLDHFGGPDRALNREIGEQGVGLSGGERQRLAIARALLSPRPLIILDEPTASLDAQSRQLVIKAIAERREDQSVLIVSHNTRDREWVDDEVSLGDGVLPGEGSAP